MARENVTMALNVVPGTLAGITAVQAGIGQVAGSIGQFTNRLTRATDASHGLVLALGAGLTLAMAEAAQAYGEFERGLKIAQAVASQTNKDISILSQQATKFSVSYRMGIDEITKGLQTLGRAGLSSVNTQIDVLNTGLGAAKLSGLELNEVLEKLVSTTSLLGGDITSTHFAQELQGVSDKIIATSMTAPIDMSDIVQTLSFSGGTAAAGGINIQNPEALYDYLGSISAFAQKGVTGSIAGTALRAFFTKPAAQDKSVVEALGKINLNPEDLWTNNGQKMRKVSDQIGMIHKAMAKAHLSQLDQIELWGDIVGAKMGQQMMKLDENTIKQTANRIQHAVSSESLTNMTLQNFASDVEKFKKQLESIWRDYGKSISQWIDPVLRGVSAILDLIGNSPVLRSLTKTLGVGLLLAAISFIGNKLKSLIDFAKRGAQVLIGQFSQVNEIAEAHKNTANAIQEENSRLGLTENQTKAINDAVDGTNKRFVTSTKLLDELFISLNKITELMKRISFDVDLFGVNRIQDISSSQFSRFYGEDKLHHKGEYVNPSEYEITKGAGLLHKELVELANTTGISYNKLQEIYNSEEFRGGASSKTYEKYGFFTGADLLNYLKRNNLGPKYQLDDDVNDIEEMAFTVKNQFQETEQHVKNIEAMARRIKEQAAAKDGIDYADIPPEYQYLYDDATGVLEAKPMTQLDEAIKEARHKITTGKWTNEDAKIFLDKINSLPAELDPKLDSLREEITNSAGSVEPLKTKDLYRHTQDDYYRRQAEKEKKQQREENEQRYLNEHEVFDIIDDRITGEQTAAHHRKYHYNEARRRDSDFGYTIATYTPTEDEIEASDTLTLKNHQTAIKSSIDKINEEVALLQGNLKYYEELDKALEESDNLPMHTDMREALKNEIENLRAHRNQLMKTRRQIQDRYKKKTETPKEDLSISPEDEEALAEFNQAAHIFDNNEVPRTKEEIKTFYSKLTLSTGVYFQSVEDVLLYAAHYADEMRAAARESFTGKKGTALQGYKTRYYYDKAGNYLPELTEDERLYAQWQADRTPVADLDKWKASIGGIGPEMQKGFRGKLLAMMPREFANSSILNNDNKMRLLYDEIQKSKQIDKDFRDAHNRRIKADAEIVHLGNEVARLAAENRQTITIPKYNLLQDAVKKYGQTQEQVIQGHLIHLFGKWDLGKEDSDLLTQHLTTTPKGNKASWQTFHRNLSALQTLDSIIQENDIKTDEAFQQYVKEHQDELNTTTKAFYEKSKKDIFTILSHIRSEDHAVNMQIRSKLNQINALTNLTGANLLSPEILSLINLIANTPEEELFKNPDAILHPNIADSDKLINEANEAYMSDEVKRAEARDNAIHKGNLAAQRQQLENQQKSLEEQFKISSEEQEKAAKRTNDTIERNVQRARARHQLSQPTRYDETTDMEGKKIKVYAPGASDEYIKSLEAYEGDYVDLFPAMIAESGQEGRPVKITRMPRHRARKGEAAYSMDKEGYAIKEDTTKTKTFGGAYYADVDEFEEAQLEAFYRGYNEGIRKRREINIGKYDYNPNIDYTEGLDEELKSPEESVSEHMQKINRTAAGYNASLVEIDEKRAKYHNAETLAANKREQDYQKAVKLIEQGGKENLETAQDIERAREAIFQSADWKGKITPEILASQPRLRDRIFGFIRGGRGSSSSETPEVNITGFRSGFAAGFNPSGKGGFWGGLLNKGMASFIDFDNIKKANEGLSTTGKIGNTLGGIASGLMFNFGAVEIAMMGFQTAMQIYSELQQSFNEKLAKYQESLSEAQSGLDEATDDFIEAYEEKNKNKVTQEQKDEAFLNALYTTNKKDDGLDKYRNKIYNQVTQVALNTGKIADMRRNFMFGDQGGMAKNVWGPLNEMIEQFADNQDNAKKDQWEEDFESARETYDEEYGTTSYGYNTSSLETQLNAALLQSIPIIGSTIGPSIGTAMRMNNSGPTAEKDAESLEKTIKDYSGVQARLIDDWNDYSDYIDKIEDYSDQAKYATSIIEKGIDQTGPAAGAYKRIFGFDSTLGDYQLFEQDLHRNSTKTNIRMAESINNDPEFFRKMGRLYFGAKPSQYGRLVLQGKTPKDKREKEEKILTAIMRHVGGITKEQAKQTLVLSTIAELNSIVKEQIEPQIVSQLEASMSGLNLMGSIDSTGIGNWSVNSAVNQGVSIISAQLASVVQAKQMELAAREASATGLTYEEVVEINDKHLTAANSKYTEEQIRNAQQIDEKQFSTIYDVYGAKLGLTGDELEENTKRLMGNLTANGATTYQKWQTIDKYMAWAGEQFLPQELLNSLNQDVQDYDNGTGSGSSDDDKNKDSNKSRKNWVNLAICNKKEIPKLNVNLFKKPPNFTILNRNFKLRDVNVNTADDAKSIQNAVKNSIIEIQNRSNPKIIQDDSAEYDPVNATEGNTLPTGTKKTE